MQNQWQQIDVNFVREELRIFSELGVILNFTYGRTKNNHTYKFRTKQSC